MGDALWPVVALTVVAALALLWQLTRRKKPKAWIQEAVCSVCGWRGQTSRYAGRCPRCNAPIGDLKGTPRK